MIIPSSTNLAPRSQSIPALGQPASPSRIQHKGRFSTESASLKIAFERQLAIRPEALARAKALAADSDYPSEVMIKRLAQHFLSAPDLSSGES